MVVLRKNKYLCCLQTEPAAFFIEHQNYLRTTDKIWLFTLEYLVDIISEMSSEPVTARKTTDTHET